MSHHFCSINDNLSPTLLAASFLLLPRSEESETITLFSCHRCDLICWIFLAFSVFTLENQGTEFSFVGVGILEENWQWIQQVVEKKRCRMLCECTGCIVVVNCTEEIGNSFHAYVPGLWPITQFSTTWLSYCAHNSSSPSIPDPAV